MHLIQFIHISESVFVPSEEMALTGHFNAHSPQWVQDVSFTSIGIGAVSYTHLVFMIYELSPYARRFLGNFKFNESTFFKGTFYGIFGKE